MARETKLRGVLPLAATYISFGWFWGSWSVIFLDFLHSRLFSYGRVSVYLTSLTIASMVTMVLITPRITHLLPSASLPLALGFYGAGIALMPWVPDTWLLFAFAVTGIGTGLIDVLVNQIGHDLEVGSGSSVLQPVHAAYSIGAVLGAVCAALILDAGGPAAFRAVIFLAAGLQALPFLACLLSPAYRARPRGKRSAETMSLSAFVRNPALLIVALIVLSAFFVEGSLDVWAVTYLRVTLDATVLAGALGFAAFAAATAVGRLFAARILFGMGYRCTIILSGIGSATAGAVALFAPSPLVASVAYLVLGFSLASAAPAAFGAVGGEGAEAGISIAAVTTAGYAGFVIGPPVMGWLADAAGVQSTMAIITIATLGILLGGFLSPSGTPPDRELSAS